MRLPRYGTDARKGTAVIDWLDAKIVDITGLVQSGIVLAAIVSVAIVYFRTKQLVATATAALLAGVVIWATNNIGWFEQKVGEEAAAAGSVVVTLAHAVGSAVVGLG